MRLLFFFISFFFCSEFLSQSPEYTVSGFVKEDSTANPIPGVKIYSAISKENYVYTDESGYYELKLPLDKGTKLVFDHVGFEKEFYYVKNRILKRSDVVTTRKLRVDMLLTYKVLPEIVIGASKVDTVFGSEQYSVEDFIVLPNNRLLLLGYEKKIDKNPKLLLVDASQKILMSYVVPGVPEYLHKDYSNNNYVVCENKVYQVIIRGDVIALRKVENEDFYGFYNRVIDTIGDNFYYSNYNELYPAVKFFATNRGDTSHHELYEVKDNFMMELYRAQYKYVSGRDKLWAYRQEQATGIDKEIWVGASSFTQELLYQPVYAPLFVVNDTVLLFDQYKNIVLKFTEYNDKIEELKIDYHLVKGTEKWEKPLLKDPLTNQIYAIFDRGGYTYVKHVNYYTGETSKMMKLKFRFVERIKIVNNQVYYIYRPFESLQKKFLYKEAIN